MDTPLNRHGIQYIDTIYGAVIAKKVIDDDDQYLMILDTVSRTDFNVM